MNFDCRNIIFYYQSKRLPQRLDFSALLLYYWQAKPHERTYTSQMSRPSLEMI